MLKISIRKAMAALMISLVLLPLGQISAGVILTTSVGSTGQNPVSTGSASSTGAPIFSEVVGSGDRDAGSARAIALIGNLGAESRSHEFGFSNVATGAEATYSDTVVFSGPGTDPILVQLNLHFGGSVNSVPGANAAATASASINGAGAGSLLVSNAGGVPDASSTFSGLGAVGTDYDTTLTTSSIEVPLNTPVPIELILDAFTSAFGQNASSSSLFSDTFGFVTGGPLFNLPNGYTVNSPTSFIVNNRFTPAGAPVPEPSTLVIALFGAGLVGLGKRLRRRKTEA